MANTLKDVSHLKVEFSALIFIFCEIILHPTPMGLKRFVDGRFGRCMKGCRKNILHRTLLVLYRKKKFFVEELLVVLNPAYI